jgi:hypothetical protein
MATKKKMEGGGSGPIIFPRELGGQTIFWAGGQGQWALNIYIYIGKIKLYPPKVCDDFQFDLQCFNFFNTPPQTSKFLQFDHFDFFFFSKKPHPKLKKIKNKN